MSMSTRWLAWSWTSDAQPRYPFFVVKDVRTKPAVTAAPAPPPVVVPGESKVEVNGAVPVRSKDELDASRRADMLASIGRVVEADPVKAPLPIVRFVSATLDEDFLHFLPPQEKKSVLAAMKEAASGTFDKLRHLARYFSAKSTLERALNNASVALEKAEGTEKPLDGREKQAIRELFEGPLSQAVVASGLPAPTDLPSLLRAIEDPKVKAAMVDLRALKAPDRASAALDVQAALDVAKAVLGTLKTHFEVGIADQSILDGDKVRPERLAELPAPLRIILTHPDFAPAAIAALARGEVLSAQVMKQTPEHLIEDLRDVSRTLAGGSFLWVDDFLATKRRPHITGGDLRKTKVALEGAAAGLLKLSERGVAKIAAELSADERGALSEILSSEAGPKTAAGLRQMASGLTGRPVSHDLERLAKAHDTIDELRQTDPEALLKESNARLDRFDAERKQAMRVRVHGSSPGSRGLDALIRKSPLLEQYRQSVVEHTVGAQYAAEASKSAKNIVFGVAALSMVGVPLEKHLGASVMSAILSTAEDVMGWAGEAMTLKGQGLSWKDIILGWRNAGLVPTLALAMGLAGHAEHVASTGHGLQAGGMLALGATALTIYTSMSSALLFRQIGREMIQEGKIPAEHDRELGKAATEPALRRATDALLGPDAPVPSALKAQMDRAYAALETKLQGTPDGYALARELSEQDPSLSTHTLDAIAKGYDDALGFLRSGADPQASVDALAQGLSEKFIETLKNKGAKVGPTDALVLEKKVRGALAGLGGAEVSPLKLAQVTKDILTAVMETAAGGPLNVEQKAMIDQTAKELEQDADRLQAELRTQLKPELKKVLNRFAVDQVLANPVRRQLIEAVGIGIAVSIGVGGLFPGLLKLPLTIAVLGSMESVITAVRLKINEVRHERALHALGEQFVPSPTAETAPGYLPSTG